MTGWFDAARFGMFIHWGHGSQQGWELSWPLAGGGPVLPHCQDVAVDTYHASAETFDPRPGSPREWLALARHAGMQYAVLTAKHHDGFALFHTRTSDFSIEHAPYAGDLVREYVEATREAGLRVGLYFSLADWHHPDYPPFRETDKPYRLGQYPKAEPEAWERFRACMFEQVRELLTNYGKIDVLWFDGGWERTPQQWDTRGLHDLIRSLQPEILINDRLPGFGDFRTPEQFVPPEPPGERWETCMTMNESWGFNPSDTDYKSARDLVHALCEVASRGGNLLLNVSPRGDGSLPPEQIERLEAVGDWTAPHGESIFDTRPGLEPWQFYGPTTRRGDRVYAHLLSRPYDSVTVRGVPIRRVAAVRDVGSGTPLAYRTRCSIVDQLVNGDPPGELLVEVPESLVDPLATTIEIDLSAEPQRSPASGA